MINHGAVPFEPPGAAGRRGSRAIGYNRCMLMYIDPGTGGAIFSSLPALLAAVGSGIAVVCGFAIRPFRRLLARLWAAMAGKKRAEPPAVQ